MNQPKFTRGPVMADFSRGDYLIRKVGAPGDIAQVFDVSDANEDTQENRDLIVAAFNAATECCELGFNGIKALEALPALLKTLQYALEDLEKLNAGHAAIEDVCGIIPDIRTRLVQAGMDNRAKETA